MNSSDRNSTSNSECVRSSAGQSVRLRSLRYDVESRGTTATCEEQGGRDPNVIPRRRRPYQVRSHGHRREARTTLTYKSWINLRRRAIGGHTQRGDYSHVNVCQRWDRYENFLADMGPRPSSAHSIDRIDPSGDYEPGNCRWATHAEQARNKSTTRLVTHPVTGETKCSADWANELGIAKSTMHWRLGNWSLERVFGVSA